MLEGVNVALGVTGSIAAVKVVELAHELRRQGAAVRGVLTGSAQGIIHPWAVEFATGHEPVTEITGQVEHVDLCGREGWADVLLIAPAMHEPMYDHPGVLEAIETVESWGVEFVDPRIEEGKAKIATEEAIVTEVARATAPDSLAGEHVVVTSGATSEPIDPIRTITNRASGKTGRAVAKACYVRGADVTLVHDGDDVPYTDVRQVERAAEMRDAVLETLPDATALLSAAAISDYTVDAAPEKIKSGEARTLTLEPAPKLIDAAREAYPDLPIVGFKAETDGDDTALVPEARRILERAGLSFVVANDASVMGEDETRALVVRRDDYSGFSGSKTELGERVAEELAEVLGGG